jgi:hypothetical protein
LLTKPFEPGPLLVSEAPLTGVTSEPSTWVYAWISPAPDALLGRLPRERRANTQDPAELPTLDEVRAWLRVYPTLGGNHPPSRIVEVHQQMPGVFHENEIVIGWELDDPVD